MPDRTPPASQEAERSVLGAMISSEAALLHGLEALKEEDFYYQEHRMIFKAITQLFERRVTVDPITLIEELEREGILEEVGGRDYIYALMDSVISAHLIDVHSKIVLDKSLTRRLIDTADKIIAEAHRGTRDADELLDWAEAQILDIRARRLPKGFSRLGELAQRAMERVESARSANVRGVTGLPSGFRDLDQLTSGFHPGDMVVVASRPSVGKTTLVANIHLTLGKAGIPSAMFTLEMTEEAMALRFLAMESGVKMEKIRSGYLSPEDMRKLAEAVARLENLPIYLEYNPSIGTVEIKARTRRVVREKNVQLVSVDYIQLVQAPRRDTREQQVAHISQSLKALAGEMKIVVLTVSQLSRRSEQEDRPPRLSDLRESGRIEQDADMVIFLHKPQQEGNLLDVIVAKHRNGPTGRVRLVFRRDILRFSDAARDEDVGFLDLSGYEDYDLGM